MLTRPFDSSNYSTNAASRLSPSLQMSSLAVPISRPDGFGAGSASRVVEWPAEVIVDRNALGRGVCWALGIEGTAALFIFMLWHLWTLVR